MEPAEGVWGGDRVKYFEVNGWSFSPDDGDTATRLRKDAEAFLLAADAFEKAGYID